MSPRLAVLSAAAATVVVAASPAVAQSPAGQTLKFREVEKDSHFKYIDNAPRTTMGKQGPRRVSAGDQFVIASPLADATGRIGGLRAACTASRSSRSFDKAHFFCTGAYALRGGALFLAVADTGGNAVRGAVTGGTGAYAGARGTFTSTDTKTGANVVVTLLP